MPFASASLQTWVVFAAILALGAIITCVIVLKVRAQRRHRQVAFVNAVILDYFRRSGVEVTVCSVSLMNNQRFTALIESEPMKRFRLSHIIEITLREHLAKISGLELDKIYWRFPIKEAASNGTSTGVANDKPAAKSTDEYINEGLVNYRDLPKVDVSEISWEKFEEVALHEATPAAEPETVAPGR